MLLNTLQSVELRNPLVVPFACEMETTGAVVPVTAIGEVPETLVTLVGNAVLCHVVPFEVRTLPLVPGATACNEFVPLPSRTLFAASVLAPVPPLATASVPDVMIPALIGGMSDALNVVPAVTRP